MSILHLLTWIFLVVYIFLQWMGGTCFGNALCLKLMQIILTFWKWHFCKHTKHLRIQFYMISRYNISKDRNSHICKMAFILSYFEILSPAYFHHSAQYCLMVLLSIIVSYNWIVTRNAKFIGQNLKYSSNFHWNMSSSSATLNRSLAYLNLWKRENMDRYDNCLYNLTLW